MFRLEDLIRGAWHDSRVGTCGGHSKGLDIENGSRVRAGGEPPGREVLAARAMPCPSHLLTVRSVELGSLGSAKPGANCVNNPLQSRNSHAKLQTTPRHSEINRHAAGTTSPTCFECDAKNISRLSDMSARNRCRPSPHAKRTKRRSTTRRNLPKPGGVPPAATSGTPDREHPF